MNMERKMGALRREAIAGKLDLICVILGIDRSMPREERLAEVLQRCLFDRNGMDNPLSRLKDHSKNGRFDTPEAFDEQKRTPCGLDWPMSDEEYEALKGKVLLLYMLCWNGKFTQKPFELVQNILEKVDDELDPDDPQLVRFMGYDLVNGYAEA